MKSFASTIFSHRALALLLAGCLATSFAVEASASTPTTLVVTKTEDTNDGTCDADCSLREAFIRARSNAGEEIIILPEGIYTLTIPGRNENYYSATGDLNMEDHQDPITIQGAGAATTIIQAGTDPSNGIDRVFGIGAFTKLNISDVTIRHGRAEGIGGGLNVDRSTLTLIRCVVSNNYATTAGGGIFANGGVVMRLLNSTISGNVAGTEGGGIACITNMWLQNCTLSGNTALRWGGGIYNAGQIILEHCTLSDNSAVDGAGGIHTEYYLASSNSIFRRGASGPNLVNVYLPNDVESHGGNISSDGTGPNNYGSDRFHTDPMLGPLQDNGGPTLTHRPLPGSPALDSGQPLAIRFDFVPGNSYALAPFDQRGVGYPRRVGSGVDVGAVETQRPVVACATAAAIDCSQPAMMRATISTAVPGPVTVRLSKGSNVLETRTLTGPLSDAVVDFNPVALDVGGHTLTVAVTDAEGSAECASTVSVSTAAQTIHVAGPAPASAAFGSSFTVLATGGSSGNPVTYSSSGACTNDGATFTMTSGSGTCTVRYEQAGGDCHEPATEVIETVNATPAPVMIDLGAIDFSYDGAAKAISPSTSPNGVGVSVTYNGVATAPTEAGNYAVVATVTDPNYQGSASGTLVIAPADTSTTVACPPSVTFNGNAFTPCTAQVSGPGGLSEALTLVYANNVNAGTATATAEYPGSANYSASSGSANFTIMNSTVLMSVSSDRNPSAVGEAVSFSAQVTPTAASGTVQFQIDGVDFGAPVALTNGSATSGATSTLAAGSRVISAVYSGGGGYDMNSATVTQNVGVPVKITGGGKVGSTVHFGFNVKPNAEGTSAAGYKGHLQFQDTGVAGGGLRFKSTSITSEFALDSHRGTFTGTGTWNGAGSYPYLVTVEDNAHHGAGSDRFRLQVYNGDGSVRYDSHAQPGTNGGLLTSGKVKIHYGPETFTTATLAGLGSVLNGTVDFDLDVRKDATGGFGAGGGLQFTDPVASSFVLTTESITSMVYKGRKVTVIGPAMFNGTTGYRLELEWDTDKRKLAVVIFNAANGQKLYDSRSNPLSGGSITYTAGN